MPILTFIAAAIALALLKRWDMGRSLSQPLYTWQEANKLTRGKDGYFSLTKSLIVAAAAGYAPAFVMAYFFGWYAGAAWLGMCCLALLAYLPKFHKNKNAKKDEEFATLNRIKADPDNALTCLGTATEFKDQQIFKPFYDIRGNTVGELLQKFRKLAAKPASDWWKLDRAKSL